MTDRSGSGAADEEAAAERAKPAAGGGPRASHVSADIRDISFHTAVRGYERREVDRYVQRVNQVIAELEIARSPEAAVRHALDRVGEQTSGILQQARETADAIISTARAEAEQAIERATTERREIVERARTEAAAIVADAGKEAHERAQQGERELAAARKRAEEAHLQADAALAQARSRADELVGEAQGETDAILSERRRIVEEIRELTGRLAAIADPGKHPGSEHSAASDAEQTLRHQVSPANPRAPRPRQEQPTTDVSRS